MPLDRYKVGLQIWAATLVTGVVSIVVFTFIAITGGC